MADGKKRSQEEGQKGELHCGVFLGVIVSGNWCFKNSSNLCGCWEMDIVLLLVVAYLYTRYIFRQCSLLSGEAQRGAVS